MTVKKQSDSQDISGALDVVEDVYKKQWWPAVLMLIERSTQQDIDEDVGYTTGLIWTTLYDLHGAMKKKSIKNPKVLELWVNALAKKYDFNTEKLWYINQRMLKASRPDSIYFDIYIHLDHEFAYNPTVKEDPAVIEGFTMIANNLLAESRIGYMLDHLHEIK